MYYYCTGRQDTLTDLIWVSALENETQQIEKNVCERTELSCIYDTWLRHDYVSLRCTPDENMFQDVMFRDF